ncbi:MAG: hypothetical protein ACI9VF_001192, partial [Alteromonas macleodii]
MAVEHKESKRNITAPFSIQRINCGRQNLQSFAILVTHFSCFSPERTQ